MDNLKPCPFCGSPSEAIEIRSSQVINDWSIVHCPDCGAEAEGVDEWNTRAEPTEAMIEDIKLLLLFAPKDCPEGFDATFYHTLTYAGDRKLQDRIDSIRAMIAAQEREDG